MHLMKHPPVSLNHSFFHLGTPAFPAFLSLGESGIMYDLSKLLINRSQKADPNISFSPEK